ncbi:wax ester/triacylglycerol synthase family O-acyltransferase [Microlunatus spumicola]|uniref:Diacylglycerol O-acyltransferase n=1 Tax=Microlunatus spumicola TaxID=81499 RepID=A0ABP6X0D6_9ACTN
MPQRLTPLEVSLLALDTVRTPAHVGTVTVLEPTPGSGPVDRAAVAALVESRLAYVPRYRQRVVAVPGRLAAPVWVDDDDFDLATHVRGVVLPRPGTSDQLRELVARLLARRLDRSRPLWEVHVVEGLEGGRVAVVEKTHLALVDGDDTVDLAQVLLDVDPASSEDTFASAWNPGLEPGPTDLVVGALWESAQDPVRALDNLRGVVAGALGVALAVGEVVGGTVVGGLGEVAGDVLRGGRPPAGSPLAGNVSPGRRVATLLVPLADLQAVHVAHGCTVDDVVLAVVAGGLRAWLPTRDGAGRLDRPLRALVPTTVLEDETGTSSLGVAVEARVVDLPTGEPDPLVRLDEVVRATQGQRDDGRAVGARTLTEIPGFAPATLHALGARVAAGTARPPYDVLVVDVPGPQVPLYAGGARLTETFPVLPLAPGHLLAVGVTSYDGEVVFGLTADRDAVPDLDDLVRCLDDAVADLLGTTGRARPRRPVRVASPAERRAAASKAAARAEAARRRALAGRA